MHSLASKRALLIFNPAAGHYSLRRVRLFVEALRVYGWEVVPYPTRYRGHGALILREALAQNTIDLVIIGGGDGTISECVQALSGSTIPLAIFPIGSANVLAHELDIPFNDRANAAMIDHVFRNNGAKTLWPGVITAPDGRETPFIQMLGMGPDGWIVRHVSTKLKKLIGRTAYVISILKCLLSYKFAPFRLVLDGKEETLTAAILTKGRYYGGKFRIIPTSQQEDRCFEAVLFRCPNWGSFLKACLSLLLFQKSNHSAEIRTTTRVRLPPHQAITLQIDGDRHDTQEADISIASQSLKVIAP